MRAVLLPELLSIHQHVLLVGGFRLLRRSPHGESERLATWRFEEPRGIDLPHREQVVWANGVLDESKRCPLLRRRPRGGTADHPGLGHCGGVLVRRWHWRAGLALVTSACQGSDRLVNIAS